MSSTKRQKPCRRPRRLHTPLTPETRECCSRPKTALCSREVSSPQGPPVIRDTNCRDGSRACWESGDRHGCVERDWARDGGAVFGGGGGCVGRRAGAGGVGVGAGGGAAWRGWARRGVRG